MASFTKDKLKFELSKYNIPFPKDAKKEVYVELYKTHVENKDRLEFSSDEEALVEAAINHSPSKRNKKRPGSPTKKPAAKNVMNQQQVVPGQLSDDGLRDALKDCGVNPGPITDSTRRVYVKKLERLLSERNPAEPVQSVTTTNHTETVRTERVTRYVPPPETVHTERVTRYMPPPAPPAESEFSDRDGVGLVPEEDLEPEPELRPALRKRPMTAARLSPRKPSPVKKPDPPKITRYYEEQNTEEEDDDDDIPDSRPPVTRSRPATNGPAPASRPYTLTKPALVTQQKPASEESKKRFPIWLQVLILLAVCALIYFVIQNLEPSGRSFIGKVSGTAAGAK